MRTRYITLTVAAALSACTLTLFSAVAPAANPGLPPVATKPGELVVKIHLVPLKGSKGGTWGYHKQCLYGVYGSKGQYKGLHYHLNQYDRGHACGVGAREPGDIQFGSEPKSSRKAPPRLIPPSRRR